MNMVPTHKSNGNGISNLPRLSHKMEGVTIYSMTEHLEHGEDQTALVVLNPGAKIPLHKHGVDAMMVITAGTAKVISDDSKINGKIVKAGDVVFFSNGVNHGFSEAGPEGMSFVSFNGGIAASDGSLDMVFK